LLEVRVGLSLHDLCFGVTSLNSKVLEGFATDLVRGRVNCSEPHILEEVRLNDLASLGISNLALGLTENLLVSLKLVL
jgi:hypothetical protein